MLSKEDVIMNFKATYNKIVKLEREIELLSKESDKDDILCELSDELSLAVDEFYKEARKYNPKERLLLPGYQKCSDECRKIIMESSPIV